jgi:vancomycin resistance protein YoaR
MRKFLSLLTTLALLFSLAAMPAAAEAIASSAVITVDENSSALLNNIRLAVDALNGRTVAYGETFSFNDAVGPRTTENGYKKAENGRGSKVLGGGVSQVASALYMALEGLGGIEYLEKKTYGDSFTGSYVLSGDEAILTDYSEGIDFSFVNGHDTFRIDMALDGEDLTCELVTGVDYSSEEALDAEDDDFSDYFSDESDSGEPSWEDEDEGHEAFTDEADDESRALGSATINVSGSSALKNNIRLACKAINGFTLEPGETFSFNGVVGERSEENGYQSAVNGRGAKVVGGGVAQVASALWLAAKDADGITVTKVSTYGKKYNQSYVDDPDDAILTDYNANIDFCFRYDGSQQLTILAELQDDESIVVSLMEG